jgi:hypothetical protein
MRRLIFILMIALSATGANAKTTGPDTSSANYLLEGCRVLASGATPSQDNIFRPTLCMGEMKALMFFASSVNSPNRACPPQQVSTYEQVAKVVVAYLDAHPESLHENFLGLAYTALAQAWPCKL